MWLWLCGCGRFVIKGQEITRRGGLRLLVRHRRFCGFWLAEYLNKLWLWRRFRFLLVLKFLESSKRSLLVSWRWFKLGMQHRRNRLLLW